MWPDINSSTIAYGKGTNSVKEPLYGCKAVIYAINSSMNKPLHIPSMDNEPSYKCVCVMVHFTEEVMTYMVCVMDYTKPHKENG